MIWSILTVSSRLFISFGMFYILSQSLEISEFGQITYLITISVIFYLIIDYGYNLKLSRDCVGCTDTVLGEKVKNSLIVKSINFVISLLLVFYIEGESYLLFLLVLGQYLNSIGSTVFPILRANQDFKSEAKVVILNNSITIFSFFLLLFVFGFKPELAFAYSIILGKTLLVLIAFIYFYNKVKFPKSINVKKIKEHYNLGLAFFIHASVGFLYINVDTILTEKFLTYTDVGLYQMVMKVLIGSCILNDVMVNYFLPKMTLIAKSSSQSSFKNVTFKYWSWFTGIGIVVSIVFFLTIFYLSPIIFSPHFNYDFWFSITMASIVFLRYFGVMPGILLTILDFQNARVFGGLAALIVLVFCSVFLAQELGITGIAVSSLCAHLVINVIYVYALKIKVKRESFLSQQTN